MFWNWNKRDSPFAKNPRRFHIISLQLNFIYVNMIKYAFRDHLKNVTIRKCTLFKSYYNYSLHEYDDQI